jgi:hypothetical protein
MKKFLLLCACLVSYGLQASDCKFEVMIDQTLDLSGSQELSVQAAAGSLEITGMKGSDVASIKGRVCVSEEEWLEESGVKTSSGNRAEIIVNLADTDDGGSWTGNNYAYLDLELEVPEGIRLNVRDSSGDMKIAHAPGPVSIKDSSGEIRASKVDGEVMIPAGKT